MTKAHPKVRRLLALCVLTWLNLLLQPCLAQAPAAVASASHCEHADGGHAPASCPEMTAEGCVTSSDSSVSTTPASGPVRTDLLVVRLPPIAAAVAIHSHSAGERAGVPLTIRYCSLSN